MPYDPVKHHRRSIRLQGYDYSQAGLYFITIRTQNREHLFGKIENGKMISNDAGRMVETVWNEIPHNYNSFAIRNFVIMPNHIHGIIEITKPKTPETPHAMTLPDIVHRFKTFTTKQYTDGVKQKDWIPFPGRLWQRNYYEQIIRDENSYQNIYDYINHNPLNWTEDEYYDK